MSFATDVEVIVLLGVLAFGIWSLVRDLKQVARGWPWHR